MKVSPFYRPKFYETESKKQASSRKRGVWDENKFFEELNRNVSNNVFEATRDFYNFLKEQESK